MKIYYPIRIVCKNPIFTQPPTSTALKKNCIFMQYIKYSMYIPQGQVFYSRVKNLPHPGVSRHTYTKSNWSFATAHFHNFCIFYLRTVKLKYKESLILLSYAKKGYLHH
jgi:hypothetical protein